MESTVDIFEDEQKSKTLKELPGPKPKFLVGNLTEFSMAQIHTYVNETANKYGPMSLIRLGPKPFVIASNSDTIQSIMKQRPQSFRRVSNIESVFGDMGIVGLFSSEGEKWKRHRKLVLPGFKPALLKAFYPSMVNTSEKLGAVLSRSLSTPQNHVAFDIQALFKNYATDVTTKLAFGGDFDCLQAEESELQACLKLIFPMVNSRTKSPFPLWRYFKLPKDYALDKAIKTVKGYLNEFLVVARNNLATGAEPQNILESMIQAVDDDDDGDGFTEDELFGNAMTLLLAGEDTTANTLAWTIHYLAQNPAIQDEVYLEIKANLKGKVPEFAELDNFPLTYACAQEAMRLKPVVPLMTAQLLQDLVIEGYAIPKDTVVFMLINYQSGQADTFPNPDKFDPTRWTELTAERIKSNAKASMPFGGGARICPGRALSIIEMKVALITILNEFRFTHHDGIATTQERVEFTLVPKNLKVNIYQR